MSEVSVPTRMGAADLVRGYPLGFCPELVVGRRGPRLLPRQALEEVIRPVVACSPCIVAFSGGRDSSTILAVAVEVARKEGLPAPIPVTRRFVDAPRAEESRWQELMIGHLGISDWVIEHIVDEMDVVGPLAAPVLRRFGVLWPPLLHGDDFFLRHAGAGGGVLDGEGGDNVLGPESHRLAPVSVVARRLRGRKRPSRAQLRGAAEALAPKGVRAQRTRAKVGSLPLPWLREPALEELADAYAAHVTGEPLNMRRSIERIPAARSVALLVRNRRFLAEERGVRFVSPFLDPLFIRALAATTPILGPTTRSETLRHLVGDLLPVDVRKRRSKAEFGQAIRGRFTQEFAANWSGRGVDTSRVDPEVLRSVWLAPESNALANALLQAAWLADDDVTPT